MKGTKWTIKELPETERPREKLIAHGVDALSNDELIAVIIRTGSSTETAVDVGGKVLALDKTGLRYLMDTTLEELMTIKGVGECKASQILAAIELGKRISYEQGMAKVKVGSPKSVSMLFEDMKYLKKEHFRVLLLDVKNQVISVEEISIGTLNSAIVHPRDVFKVAIKKNANAIILVHNHPSGDTSPSNEDIRVTNRLLKVGELVGIKVLDHLIIGDSRYLSFKEEKLM